MAAKKTTRNPSMLVFRIMWSVAHGRAVRIVQTDGKVVEARVERCVRDPRRDVKNATEQNSTMVAWLESGQRVPVNEMADVQPAAARSWAEAEAEAAAA